MKIINVSVYTIKSYRAFQKLLYKKVKLLSYITSFLLCLIGVLLLFFQYAGYIYLVLAISLPIFVHYFIKLLESENIKKNALLRCGARQTFSFLDECVSINQVSKLGDFNDEYYYKELLSVYKSKEYYFLFITRTQAFIMERNGFVGVSEEEFDTFLKEKIGKRFIDKARK